MQNGVLFNAPGHEEMLRGLLLALRLDMVDQKVHQLIPLPPLLIAMIVLCLCYWAINCLCLLF